MTQLFNKTSINRSISTLKRSFIRNFNPNFKHFSNMNFSTRTLFLLPFLALFAQNCAKKNAPKEQTGPIAMLETGACRGFCPIVSLTFNADGSVDYEGIRFVKKIGKDRFQLSKNELADLKNKVKNLNLSQYDDRYKSDIMDLPSATVTTWDGRKKKSVSGTAGRPQPVQDFQNYLSGLATVHGFPVMSYNPDDEIDEKIAKSIIVELKPAVNPGNWIMQFQDIRLRLVRRISPDRNTWLVNFNPNEIDQESLISLVKSSADVVEAQGNMEVKDRN